MATARAPRTLACRRALDLRDARAAGCSSLCALLTIVVLGSGCGSSAGDRAPRPEPTEPTPRVADPLPEGVTLRTVEHLGARYVVASLDLREVELDLYGQGPEGRGPAPQLAPPRGAQGFEATPPPPGLTTIPALRAWLTGRGRRMVLATNAGIFETDGRPLGLHIERGVELMPRNLADAPGNFFLKPNAVFYVVTEGGLPRARVVETSAFDEPVAHVRLATQSGPALLLNGALHPRFLPDSDSFKLRSGVGVAASAPHVVHLALSEGEVRFHDFGTLFRDVLACTDALFLDGTISVLNAPGRRGAAHEGERFGGILVVSEPR